MTESYLAVAGRIRRELEHVEAVSERAQSIWAEVNPNEEDDYRVDAVALNLHGFYAGLERIFETIARRVDQTVPDGEPGGSDVSGMSGMSKKSVSSRRNRNQAMKLQRRYLGGTDAEKKAGRVIDDAEYDYPSDQKFDEFLRDIKIWG